MTPRRRSLFVLLLWCLCGPALARDIADMTGQTVNLPDRPLRAFASIPPLTSFLEVVAPDVVVALNRPLTDGERPYLSPGLSTLPVAGGWFGNGAGANLELLASLRPDVIVMEAENPVAGDIKERLAPLGTIVVRVKWERLDDYPALFRFLGSLLGQPERGETLASYAEQTIGEIDAKVTRIPADRHPLVYYAQSADGLRTACANTVHVEVIRRAGGRPVVDCDGMSGHKGWQTLSLEKIIALAPDVIITGDPGFLSTIRDDARWQQVKAVAQGRVYSAPSEPYGWLDRPPVFTRLMGLRWAFAQLHGQGSEDLAVPKDVFLRLFFGPSSLR